jgi:hypothetical protein
METSRLSIRSAIESIDERSKVETSFSEVLLAQTVDSLEQTIENKPHFNISFYKHSAILVEENITAQPQ